LVSVENITSRTIEEERNRGEKFIDVFKMMEQKRRHKQAYYIVLADENTNVSGNKESYIIY
jgi:hypothetical protein